MNPTTLQDLELPPAPLPDYLWWLLALVVLLLLGSGWMFWRHWQHPVVKALRRLDKLPDDPANLPQLVALVRTAGQTIPPAFEHARFAPTPCTPATFAALKREARALLEQAR